MDPSNENISPSFLEKKFDANLRNYKFCSEISSIAADDLRFALEDLAAAHEAMQTFVALLLRETPTSTKEP